MYALILPFIYLLFLSWFFNYYNTVIPSFTSCKINMSHYNRNKKTCNVRLWQLQLAFLPRQSYVRSFLFHLLHISPSVGLRPPLCGLFGIVSWYDGSICRRYWSVAGRRKKSSTQTFVFTKENAAQHNWQHKSNPPRSGSLSVSNLLSTSPHVSLSLSLSLSLSSINVTFPPPPPPPLPLSLVLWL